MNTKAKIRLIAMDMDGTLLNDEKRISDRTAKTLKRAAQKGIHIAICSGRLCGDSGLFALDAGLENCYILSLNGAYCLNKPNGKPYASYTLAKETQVQCLEVLSRYDVTYGCFWENHMLAVESSKRTEKRGWGTHRNRPGAPDYFRAVDLPESALQQSFAKIVYVEEHDLSRIEKIREDLQPIQGLDITSSWDNNLELMPSGICKGRAIEELAGRLGISAENVMAFGDYDNDLSMIEYAGYGIAMENGSDAVKQAAGHVTLSNQADGVAEAIERFVLQDEAL